MATMIPVSSSNKRSSRGTPPRNSRIVQSRSKTDVIERFFSWSETAFCPHHTGKIPFSQADGRKDEDMLEYVFDNVESFTCAAPPLTDRNGKQPLLADKRNSNSNSNNTSNNNTHTHYLNEDENSLVEEGQVPLPGRPRPRAAVRHSGDDMLDYCFDHVESLVCTEGNEALVLAPIPNVPRVSTLGSYSEAGRRLMPKKKQQPTTSAERSVVNNNTNNGQDKNKKLSAKLQKRRAKAAIEEQLNYLASGGKNNPPPELQKGRKQTASAIEAQLESSEDRDKQDQTTTTTMSTTRRGNWFDGISRISTSKKKAMKQNHSSIIVNTINDDRSESIPYHISTTTPTSSRPAVVAVAPRPVTPPHCYHEEEDLQLYFRPIRNTTSF